ncbi:hypothetical protein BKI49_02350 [Streptomyces sp. Tue6028]|uniref:hypothetical protein n=1 Tax=Streptomyces sp. Tue6028 TaxID=2036037 RepID=UPI000BCDB9D6|nr:hypothetical protein [Streptomyces sp. Tue6028]PBC65583.1 hypothetical protein BKI49_02350 [Streptomyces sp. Tue6028]
MDDTERGGSAWRRRLSCLGVVVAVLALVAGGLVWLFRDELFHPFGDARACEGSDMQLPGVIRAGGAPIPTGASDIHYFTRNGSAQVTFESNQIPDYLHRAGILPEGKPLFDEKYGSKGVADDEIELPQGLCGSPLRGPVWIYHSTSATGSSVDVMVEVSPTLPDDFRFPARAVVTYSLA